MQHHRAELHLHSNSLSSHIQSHTHTHIHTLTYTTTHTHTSGGTSIVSSLPCHSPSCPPLKDTPSLSVFNCDLCLSIFYIRTLCLFIYLFIYLFSRHRVPYILPVQAP